MGVRACLRVDPNKKGECQCVFFGPPGTAPKSWKRLCKEASLPMRIGRTHLESVSSVGPSSIGPTGGKMGKLADDINDLALDLPPLDDLEGFEAPFLDPTYFKSALTQAGVSAAAITAASFGLSKVDLNPFLKTGIALAAAILGGRFLWDKQRDVAIGLTAGLGGFALADLVSSKFLKQPLAIAEAPLSVAITKPGDVASLSDEYESDDYLEGPRQLSEGEDDEGDEGDEEAMFEADVETETPAGDFAAVTIEEPLSGVIF